MILELIADSLGTAGLIAAGYKLYEKFRQSKAGKFDSNGEMFWAYDNRYGGFACPKCAMAARNSSQPKYCECEEYHEGHFHFECSDCHFKSIMRTGDSK